MGGERDGTWTTRRRDQSEKTSGAFNLFSVCSHRGNVEVAQRPSGAKTILPSCFLFFILFESGSDCVFRKERSTLKGPVAIVVGVEK